MEAIMLTIDKKAGAGYVEFSDKKIEYTVELQNIMEIINIDVAEDGSIVGLEFIGDIDKLPKKLLNSKENMMNNSEKSTILALVVVAVMTAIIVGLAIDNSRLSEKLDAMRLKCPTRGHVMPEQKGGK
jgi:uncharacterized protein YuzE